MLLHRHIHTFNQYIAPKNSSAMTEWKECYHRMILIYGKCFFTLRLLHSKCFWHLFSWFPLVPWGQLYFEVFKVFIFLTRWNFYVTVSSFCFLQLQEEVWNLNWMWNSFLKREVSFEISNFFWSFFLVEKKVWKLPSWLPPITRKCSFFHENWRNKFFVEISNFFVGSLLINKISFVLKKCPGWVVRIQGQAFLEGFVQPLWKTSSRGRFPLKSPIFFEVSF